MLSAPGLRFHKALAPFLQLDAGPAHPAVGGVLGYTPFYSGFLVFFYIFLCFILFICITHVSLLTLGPPDGFLCMGDA